MKSRWLSEYRDDIKVEDLEALEFSPRNFKVENSLADESSKIISNENMYSWKRPSSAAGKCKKSPLINGDHCISTDSGYVEYSEGVLTV